MAPDEMTEKPIKLKPDYSVLTSNRATSMIIVVLVVVIFSSLRLAEPHRRSKRIAFGEPVPSMDTYKTYYFVQVRRAWACVTDQTKHDLLLSRCQEDFHVCAGTLIHPEFVLTAAHCVMYYEVYLRVKGKEDDNYIWIKDVKYSLIEAWEEFEHWITGLIVIPKPRHTVYSDWALLVGSHDYYKMKQKRHVAMVFPHKKYPKFRREKHRQELNTYHDIAVLRACEAFVIKSGEVEIAPMLNTVEELRKQYERIVGTGMVCLYIGFGLQDNNDYEAKKSGWTFFKRNLLLHTWRTSKCYSNCNALQIKADTEPHPCFLCSWHHGPKLGTIQTGDSGGPVTCERKFVATLTTSSDRLLINATAVASYPLHCIKHAITEARLDYYKTVPPNSSRYHPLEGTRLRRLPLPPE